MNAGSMLPLVGQTAVVTGAARGIGAAIAHRLASLGGHVVLVARDPEALQARAAEIEAAAGSCSIAVCDLLDARAIDALASQVLSRHARIDILVNNAGIGLIGQPLYEMEPDDFDRLMGTNLRAPYLLLRAIVPSMIAARTGHILTISSLAGKNPLPNGAAYSASKWGLNGLMYSAAEELRAHNIRVSLIAPGSVNTHFGQNSATAPRDASSQDRPARDVFRKIQPEDVAHVVEMLVTQASQSFVSEVILRPTFKS